jgi:hypothetical protein
VKLLLLLLPVPVQLRLPLPLVLNALGISLLPLPLILLATLLHLQGRRANECGTRDKGKGHVTLEEPFLSPKGGGKQGYTRQRLSPPTISLGKCRPLFDAHIPTQGTTRLLLWLSIVYLLDTW